MELVREPVGEQGRVERIDAVGHVERRAPRAVWPGSSASACHRPGQPDGNALGRHDCERAVHRADGRRVPAEHDAAGRLERQGAQSMGRWIDQVDHTADVAMHGRIVHHRRRVRKHGPGGAPAGRSRAVSDALLPILERYWGYTAFRPLQREAMAAVLDRRDSLLVLPTGGGSRCVSRSRPSRSTVWPSSCPRSSRS